MKVLVTGGAGFIGYHVVKRLLEDGHSVISVDNLNPYYDPGLKRDRLAQVRSRLRYRFKPLDISDNAALMTLFTRESFDAVVHLAAQPGVRYSIENPFAYAESNVVGFLSLLECCRRVPVQHLVYASSSSVYGEDTPVPFSVDARADRPRSLYAATKRSNELMAASYSSLYGIPCTGLRYFTVYGPWGRPDMAYYRFAELMRRGEPIEVFNRGHLSRDFTYVSDAVEASVRVLFNPPANPREAVVLNVGRGEPVSLMSFIDCLERELGVEARREFVEMQPGDVHRTYADTQGLQRLIGYEPTTSLDEGIRLFAAWFREYAAFDPSSRAGERVESNPRQVPAA